MCKDRVGTLDFYSLLQHPFRLLRKRLKLIKHPLHCPPELEKKKSKARTRNKIVKATAETNDIGNRKTIKKINKEL